MLVRTLSLKDLKSFKQNIVDWWGRRLFVLFLTYTRNSEYRQNVFEDTYVSLRVKTDTFETNVLLCNSL